MTARTPLRDLLYKARASGRALGIAKYRSLDSSQSLGLTVPRAVRTALDWEKGDLILLSVSTHGSLIAQKFKDKEI